MTRNAYVDESWRPAGYVVAAIAVDHAKVAAVRGVVASTGSGKATRRHFVKESDVVRLAMLRTYASLESCEVVAAITPPVGSVIEQRSRCLRALVGELLVGGLDRVVLDHVEAVQARRDRADLAEVLAASDVEYRHEPEQAREPMLWVPDAVAWAAGRPGWRRRLDGWVRLIPA